ncbi:MAG: NAD(P)H-quinone oxidoreductase subunit 5 [Cryomorphaceae bacterium]|jgi:NAD(P)H-quinone oxidoreductase subunit 5
MAPVVSSSPFSRAWAIHLRNGLYVNTVFDRTVRSLYSHGNEQKPQVIEHLDQIEREPASEAKQRETQTV